MNYENKEKKGSHMNYENKEKTIQNEWAVKGT